MMDRITETVTGFYLCAIGFRRLKSLHNQYVDAFWRRKDELKEVSLEFLHYYRITKGECNKQRSALNLWIAATSDPVSAAGDVSDFFRQILNPRDRMWKRHFANVMIDLYKKLVDSSPRGSMEANLFENVLSVIRESKIDR